MASAKHWLKAFRLRTLPLAVSGITVGSALATTQNSIDLLLAFLIVFTALLLQILSNLANDYGDFVKGTDDKYRTDRMMASGYISVSEMKRALFACGSIAFISGCLALLIAFPEQRAGFWIFLLLGVLAIVAAVNYTVGKRPYGYHGLGDLFVFLFFGVLSVLGSGFLLSQTLKMDWILPAFVVGFLSVAVLNINNIRDIEADESAGKNTLAVVFGYQRAIKYQWLLYALSTVFLLLFTLITGIYSSLFALIIVVLQMFWWKRITHSINPKKHQWNKMLKQQAISTFVFALVFSLLIFL